MIFESVSAGGCRSYLIGCEETARRCCHPQLSLISTSVPNIDVSNGRNPAAVRLKVRFWVNGDGFVTHVFVTGANVVTPCNTSPSWCRIPKSAGSGKWR